MKTRLKSPRLLCTAVLWLAASHLHAQQNQLLVGAVSTNVGSKLLFVNATNFALSSGFTQPLVYTLVSNLVQFRAGISDIKAFYNTTNLAIFALPNTNSRSAAAGSYVSCEVVSVAGPAGGTFSFWEQGAKGPTYSYPVAATPATNLIDVTDIATGGGLPYGNPEGKIPGRRFTVDKPGEYVVGFKVHDTSANSLTFGPMHTASDIITVKFATTVETSLTRIAVTNNVATINLNQGGLTNVFVEASPELVPAKWTMLAGPFTNAPIGGNTRTLTITNPLSMATRFFRVRATGP
jgi:hypothetical protein